jgi:hypothetical protein
MEDRVPLFAALSTGQGSNWFCWPLLRGAMLCPFSLRTQGVTGLARWMVDRGVTVYSSSASIFRALMKTLDDGQVFERVRAVRLASEAATGDDLRLFRAHFPRHSTFIHMLSSSETGPIAWSRLTHEDDTPTGGLPMAGFARDKSIAILGEDGLPVPRGAVGDIAVTSGYVAAGYWRDSDLTKRRFSIGENGASQVRTGDLGRFDSAGALEFHGRRDERVKVRGNRIELAEIERAITAMPGIDRAAVVTAQPGKGEPVLVAFVVPASGASWTASRLRHALGANLPRHAVPSRIAFLDSLPGTKGTKVDREALRSLALPPRDGRAHAPRTDMEVLLANAWTEVLETADISRDDDFFDLGGDSLRGAVVAAQVHAATGVEVSLGALADHPRLSALAAFIEQRRDEGGERLPPIEPVARTASMPLSLYQRAMWPRRRAQELTHVTISQIAGPLDVEIYKACLRELVARHEILRTTFDLVDGRPAQVIHPAAPLDFAIVDVSGSDDPERRANDVFQAAAAQPIDHARLPILRHVLVRIADGHHRLARVTTFMMSDGYSSRMLERELAVLYEAKMRGAPPPLPQQARLHYGDYAVWQRQIAAPGAPPFEESIGWWRAVLSAVPPATTRLPFRRVFTSRNLDPKVGVVHWNPPAETAARLDATARQAGTTPYVIRLALFAALIAAGSGTATVVFGTFFDNRRSTDAQSIAGRCVNWLPLVIPCAFEHPFADWLTTVHARVFETLRHGEVPFDAIAEQLRMRDVALPQTEITFMLARENADQHFGGLTIISEPFATGAMPWGCTVYVDAAKPANNEVRYDANRLGRREMQALLDRYVALMDAAARQPDQSLHRLLVLIGRRPLGLTVAKWSATFRKRLKAASGRRNRMMAARRGSMPVAGAAWPAP